MKRILFMIPILLLANIYVKSAEKTLSFGYYSNFIFNYDVADFKNLPNVPNCCPQFNNGLGYGYNLGALIDFPIYRKWSFELDFGLSKFNNELKSNENLLININGEAINGEVEHYIKANFRTFDYQAFLNYNLVSSLNIGFGFGLSEIINKRYYQKETLIKPIDRGVFSDTKIRIRNVYSGIIQSDNSLIPYVSAKFTYDLPMNISNTVTFSQQLFFKIPLASYLENKKWKSYSIGLGFLIKLNSDFHTKKSIYKVNYLIDTVFLDTEDKLSVGFKKGTYEVKYDTFDLGNEIDYYNNIIGVDTVYEYIGNKYIERHIECDASVSSELSKKYGLKYLVIEKKVMTNMVPLLNYIFFDENDYKIPERYQKLKKNQIEKFNIDSMYNLSTMQIYHNILNIIAFRMKRSPKAKITIIGYNTDFGLEKNNFALSYKRAETVKNYLVNVWDISKSRIKLLNKNLPEDPSTLTEKEGLEENRRVEIISDDSDILKPVVINVTKFELPSTVVRFNLDFEEPDNIEDWYLKVFDDYHILKKFSGYYSYPIDWAVFKKADEFKGNIYYQFYVHTKDDMDYKSKKHILPIKIYDESNSQNKNIPKIYNYQLILFKYNQAELKESSMKTLKFIKKEIKGYSSIRIIGYSDKLGDEDYNKKLSLKRAENVAKELGIKDAIIDAYGENSNLFDNNLPEGRFYSRTVHIEVTK